MSFGGFDDNRGQPMAEINTTPLVDVMLVLLVIFIITAPLFNQVIPFADLARRFAEAAAHSRQPELHLRADRNTRYEAIARIMAAAQQAGVVRIAFVTDPASVH